MDLSQLETFLAVVEERGFSRAAARLHRTQPAVSHAVRRLEEEIGEGMGHLKLFVLRHATARRLFAVTERRIEEMNPVWRHLYPLQCETLLS